ncbi:MAG: hypothetical protein IPL65_15350 [Lewinellaceae bacterium]|nr:hypothetical protein [Lewinellaceae bacterium]
MRKGILITAVASLKNDSTSLPYSGKMYDITPDTLFLRSKDTRYALAMNDISSMEVKKYSFAQKILLVFLGIFLAVLGIKLLLSALAKGDIVIGNSEDSSPKVSLGVLSLLVGGGTDCRRHKHQ